MHELLLIYDRYHFLLAGSFPEISCVTMCSIKVKECLASENNNKTIIKGLQACVIAFNAKTRHKSRGITQMKIYEKLSAVFST